MRLPVVTKTLVADEGGHLATSNTAAFSVDNTVGRVDECKIEITHDGANPSLAKFYTNFFIGEWTASGTKRIKGSCQWFV